MKMGMRLGMGKGEPMEGLELLPAFFFPDPENKEGSHLNTPKAAGEGKKRGSEGLSQRDLGRFGGRKQGLLAESEWNRGAKTAVFRGFRPCLPAFLALNGGFREVVWLNFGEHTGKVRVLKGLLAGLGARKRGLLRNYGPRKLPQRAGNRASHRKSERYKYNIGLAPEGA